MVSNYVRKCLVICMQLIKNIHTAIEIETSSTMASSESSGCCNNKERVSAFIANARRPGESTVQSDQVRSFINRVIFGNSSACFYIGRQLSGGVAKKNLSGVPSTIQLWELTIECIEQNGNCQQIVAEVDGLQRYPPWDVKDEARKKMCDV